MINKIKSYLGFAIKSNEIIYGFDNLNTTKKNIKLVLYYDSISEKSLKNLRYLANNKKWKMVKLVNTSLDELLNTNNCKIVGITNENLAKVILEQKDFIQLDV